MARPRRPILSPEIIADAALALVRRSHDFTIPGIAKELGVSPASLYHHVPGGRAGIVRHMRRALYASIDLGALEDPATSWRDRLELWVRRYRDATAAVPAAIPLLIDQPVDDEPTLLVYEALFAILADAGVAPERRVAVSALADAIVFGSAVDAASPVPLWRAGDAALPQLRAATAHDDDRRQGDGLEMGIMALLGTVESLARD